MGSQLRSNRWLMPATVIALVPAALAAVSIGDSDDSDGGAFLFVAMVATSVLLVSLALAVALTDGAWVLVASVLNAGGGFVGLVATHWAWPLLGAFIGTAFVGLVARS